MEFKHPHGAPWDAEKMIGDLLAELPAGFWEGHEWARHMLALAVHAVRLDIGTRRIAAAGFAGEIGGKFFNLCYRSRFVPAREHASYLQERPRNQVLAAAMLKIHPRHFPEPAIEAKAA